MLLKNLILTALVVGKSVTSPLSIIIEIDEDRRHVQPAQHGTILPYESIIAGLESQQAVLEDLTNSVLTLEDPDSKGFEQAVKDLRTYSKILFSQKESLPKDELSEGETSFVQNAFIKSTDALTVLGEVVYGYNATIKALDTKEDFYKRFVDVRSAWPQYFDALKALLYVCDADEKKDGCEGATPFNKINGEITEVLKTAMRSIYQESFAVQFDL